MITPCRLSLTVGAIQLAYLWVLGCITPRPELKTGRNRFGSRRKTKTSRSCEVMSPAPERGDRRLRREGWASGSGEADAGKQVHLAKVPWRRRLHPWSRGCREAKCRLIVGHVTGDRARPLQDESSNLSTSCPLPSLRIAIVSAVFFGPKLKHAKITRSVLSFTFDFYF